MYKQIASFILALALVVGAGIIAPNESLARGAKSITTEVDGYTVKGKKCLIKKRCDFKFFVKKRHAPPQQYSTPYKARECLKVNNVCIEGRHVKKSPGVYTAEQPKTYYRGRGGGGWGRPPRVVHHYDGGSDIVSGVVGGVIGGAIVNWWNRPEPPPPPPPPPPEPEPAPVDTGTVVLEPFTPDWYEYCGNKYQSFDPKTGFYVSLEGGKKFCR